MGKKRHPKGKPQEMSLEEFNKKANMGVTVNPARVADDSAWAGVDLSMSKDPNQQAKLFKKMVVEESKSPTPATAAGSVTSAATQPESSKSESSKPELKPSHGRQRTEATTKADSSFVGGGKKEFGDFASVAEVGESGGPSGSRGKKGPPKKPQGLSTGWGNEEEKQKATAP